jgi:CHASE2 domain-containing sensor protein
VDLKSRLARLDRAVLGNAIPTPERFISALLYLAAVIAGLGVVLSLISAALSGSLEPLIPALPCSVLLGVVLMRRRSRDSLRRRLNRRL